MISRATAAILQLPSDKSSCRDLARPPLAFLCSRSPHTAKAPLVMSFCPMLSPDRSANRTTLR